MSIARHALTVFLLTTTVQRDTLEAVNERALQFLLQTQNADGGWGYRAGGTSYVESTAAVLLSLENSEGIARGRDFLLGLQQKDGGWGIAAMDPESGWMTAWAVIALAQFDIARDAVGRGAAWLLATSPLYITDEKPRQDVLRVFKIDSALRGFPWQSGDASWVHPTSLALRALAAAGRRDEPRVREGVAYLFDRALENGGWNVGNPWMIDKRLVPTIQDTAVALIALSVAKALSQPQVELGIQFLRAELTNAQTPAELAWGIYALRESTLDAGNLKLEIGDWVARLNALQNADGSWNGNPFITAIAIQAAR